MDAPTKPINEKAAREHRSAVGTDILSVHNIEVVYDRVILVLKGVSLHLQEGTVVALLGGNGAGKTTTLRAISGLLTAERGEIIKGLVKFKGELIHRASPSEIVKRGCIQVMEGRRCFANLTIEENLLTGAFSRPRGSDVKRDLEEIYNYFPKLGQRRKSLAGYTSGGEQQMCAIGRALMSKPSTILLDEPSMGLAPQIVEEIFVIIKRLNKRGVSFLLAEQSANIALQYADFGYVLENGRVVLSGDAQSLLMNENVKNFYLGGAASKDELSGLGPKRKKVWS